jgi:hypothetical protein
MFSVLIAATAIDVILTARVRDGARAAREQQRERHFRR